MNGPRLENWSLMYDGNPYGAPECLRIHLHGEIYNHPNPRFPDGKKIRTSRLVEKPNLKDGTARCHSRTYKLGKPSGDWVEWLRANGYSEIEDFLSRSEAPQI